MFVILSFLFWRISWIVFVAWLLCRYWVCCGSVAVSCPSAVASDNLSGIWGGDRSFVAAIPAAVAPSTTANVTPERTRPTSSSDFLVKLAYGRTFGTSTELDYATLEVSKPVRKFPSLTTWGPAVSEVQLSILGSYVFYYEGNIERTKKLNFRDGYELGWLPKGRFTLPRGLIGLDTYSKAARA